MSLSPEFVSPFSYEDAQHLVEPDLELEAALTRVDQLDFRQLKTKLIAEYRWTVETVEEIEGLYRKFLALNMRHPDRKICPTGPIDTFWHAHILDTHAYAIDCEFLFGRLLHHFPYFGMRGPEDKADLEQAFQASRELFIIHFGIDPTLGDMQARGCRPQKCP
jgi:hypothetical protein